MLTPDTIRTAIIMVKRAQCSGEESLKVADCIRALEGIFNAFVEAQQKEDAKKPAPKKTEGKTASKSSKK